MSTFLDTARADVMSGDGLVVRSPGLVAVIELGDASPTVRSRLVDVLEQAALTATPGNPVAAQLTRFILTHVDAPGFGVVSSTSSGMAVFLHGDAHYIELGVTQQHNRRLSGRSAAFAVDRLLRPPHLPFRLGVADCMTLAERRHLVTAAAPFGLVHGAVPGAGIIVDAPDPASDESATIDTDEQRPEAFVPTAALPTGTGAERPATGTTDVTAGSVYGANCSRGHLNSPDVAFCQSCGIRMSHRTADLVKGPRPPLGLLVFDDGKTHILDGDCVFGRDPGASASKARAVELDDASGTLSRTHAAIELQGWSIVLTDQNSANGTFVTTSSDESSWIRLQAYRPHLMTPGTRVRVGRREFVFESLLARI